MIYIRLRDILLESFRAAQHIVLFLLTSKNKVLYITFHLIRIFNPNSRVKSKKICIARKTIKCGKRIEN